MAKYIDKAAVVAEIEKWIEFFTNKKNEEGISQINKVSFVGRITELQGIKDFIDTLEVKEVNLVEWFDNYADGILASDIQFEPFTHLYDCAKYFFELGLKTQKGG